jgi:hypothetical protein
MIASSYEVLPPKTKSPAAVCFGDRARFSYDDLYCYLVMDTSGNN